MYYCPHPRRVDFNRGGGPRQNQVSPPRARPKQQQSPQLAPPVQILRPPEQQPHPPPPSLVPIPPAPAGAVANQSINLITLEKPTRSLEKGESSKTKEKEKGKAKIEEVDTMGVKRARQEEPSQGKEKGESSRKPTRPRRKIGISNFAMGESSRPYNLVNDVCDQGPKITWPQLLHLAPKVRRQWAKMVSTRQTKSKVMGALSGRNLEDILPVLDAHV